MVKDAITPRPADENYSLMESSFMRNLTKEGPQLEKKLVLIECLVVEPIYLGITAANQYSQQLAEYVASPGHN